MEKIYVSASDYEKVTETYRERYGYDDMSDEQKEKFDEQLDKAIGVREESSDRVDSPESKSDTEKFRDEMREKYGYDNMSDEQKERFDTALDSVCPSDEQNEGDDSNDEPEKVLRRTR